MRFGLRCALVLVVLFLGCAREPEEQPPSRVSHPLTIAYRGVAGTMDPMAENTLVSNSIYSSIFEPLVVRDANLHIAPALATDWLNPDDRTWVFHLRQGVHFHDGSPLRAEDVKFSMERALHDPHSMLASSLSMVERIDVIDERSVRIVTRKPFSILLARLVDIWILSKDYYAIAHSSTDVPPGTGPYRVKTWRPGESVDLVANPGYWEGKSAVEEVLFESVPDLQKRISGLLDHSIDMLPGLEPTALAFEPSMRQKGIKILNSPGLTVLMLGMDQRRDKTPFCDAPHNPFKDLRVRKAIYQAINIDQIVKHVLKGYASPATQLVAPKVFGFNQSISRLPFDPVASGKLLAEAGYKNGFSVQLDTTNNRYRGDAEIGRSIAEDLSKVGIRVQLNQQPFETMFSQTDRIDTSFSLFGWVLPSTDASGALDFLVHSADASRGFGSQNTGGYNNPELDRLIEESDSMIDPDQRAALLEKIMVKVMEDLPYIPLHVENNIAACASRLKWELRPDETIYLKTIREEK